MTPLSRKTRYHRVPHPIHSILPLHFPHPLRILRILRWLYAYEAAKLRNLFLLAAALFTWYLTYAMYYNIDIYGNASARTLEKASNISLLFLVFLMWVGATFAFSTLHRHHAGRQLLMLPASNAEKFLALWFIYVPLLFAVLSVAFIVGDLLRMAILPLLIEQGNQPSVIPLFFSTMWQWLTMQPTWMGSPEETMKAWSVIVATHAFCLLSSVVAGYAGWLLAGLTLYGCAYLSLDSLGGNSWQVTLLLTLLSLLLSLLAYRMFCRFPLFKSLFTFRYHDISF